MFPSNILFISEDKSKQESQSQIKNGLQTARGWLAGASRGAPCSLCSVTVPGGEGGLSLSPAQGAACPLARAPLRCLGSWLSTAVDWVGRSFRRDGF